MVILFRVVIGKLLYDRITLFPITEKDRVILLIVALPEFVIFK
jgi:coproporphyrinogen III oxidase